MAVGLSAAPLPVAEVDEWVVLPRCGATVVFSGTSRDYSGGAGGTADQPVRTGVRLLEYEAYDEQVLPRLEAIATGATLAGIHQGRCNPRKGTPLHLCWGDEAPFTPEESEELARHLPSWADARRDASGVTGAE